MTTIEDVAVPRAAPRKPKFKRVRIIRVSLPIREAVKAYKAAYLAVYGIRPSLSYDGTWIRQHGNKEGLTLKRLKELTTQLKFRSE